NEFPTDQESEGIAVDHYQVHGGEEHRKDWHYASRVALMFAVAQAIQAGGYAAEVDHQKEHRGQQVEIEVGANPGQANGQNLCLDHGIGTLQQEPERGAHEEYRNGKAERINQSRSGSSAGAERAGSASRQQDDDAEQDDLEGVNAGHGSVQDFILTPRPPSGLAEPASISSTPA